MFRSKKYTFSNLSNLEEASYSDSGEYVFSEPYYPVSEETIPLNWDTKHDYDDTTLKACLQGWEIKEMIGSGGWAKVFKICKDTCEYVIKVVPLVENTVAMVFKHEMEITKFMADHNIAPEVYANGVCHTKKGDFGYIVMEKMDRDFSEFIKVPRNAFKEIKRLVKKAHSLGVAHLDLKKANVMISGDNKIRLIDWGFAVFIGKETPLAEIEPYGLSDYYGNLYGPCLSKQRIKELTRHFYDEKHKKENYWDPRFIDKAFLCYIES